MLNNFKAGQKIRVVGDSFKNDPHGLAVGTEWTVDHVIPPTPFKSFPPIVQLQFALQGIKPYDLPARVHVKTGNNPMRDYANLVLEDVELVVEPEEGVRVRMLEEDLSGGFSFGDEFEIYKEDGELVFV